MIDHQAILRARNKTKIQHKVYCYEAMKNMLDGFAGNSISENFFGIVSCFLEKTGHPMDFLNQRDRLIMTNLRKAITRKK